MAQFMRISEAAALVSDGMTLAIGGMTLYRRPVAFVKALLRRPQPPRDLTLLAFTAGYESDLLVGAGCVSTVRTVYFGLEAFGLAPMFTERAGRGELAIIEETEASIAMGLRAAVSGIGFMPSSAWIGTDLPRLRPDVPTIQAPTSGETLMAFPAIRPDVAVIHALEADTNGNVKINNNLAADLELVYAAKQVIVTVERIVEHVAKTTGGTVIPAPGADVVVQAVNGAYPTSCHPLYRLDGEALLDYVDFCTGAKFDVYLEKALRL